MKNLPDLKYTCETEIYNVNDVVIIPSYSWLSYNLWNMKEYPLSDIEIKTIHRRFEIEFNSQSAVCDTKHNDTI